MTTTYGHISGRITWPDGDHELAPPSGPTNDLIPTGATVRTLPRRAQEAS